MVLTEDKGVALVVMDKDTYMEKCMTLLSDHKVYKEYRDLTKTIHTKVIKQLTDLKNSLGQEIKNLYSKLHPLGTTFYGFMDYLKSINQMLHSDL